MKKWGNQITKITKVDVNTFSIKLKFSDGFSGSFHLSSLFNSPKGLAAEILKGNLFNSCFIENGALAWPNGLEFCPDAIRQTIENNSKKVA